MSLTKGAPVIVSSAAYRKFEVKPLLAEVGYPCRASRTVPQRLKPINLARSYGTAEAVRFRSWSPFGFH
jgi:hypothetical protein